MEYFDLNFTEVCFHGCTWQYVTFDSGNGFALNRRRSISQPMVTPTHAVILTHWGQDEIDAICNCIFLNENVSISIKISLKFILKGPTNNIPTLVQIMVWRRPGAKPLSEPMMVILLTHICGTWSQWVNPQWVSQSVNTYRGAVSRHCLHEIVMCDACYRALFAIGIVCWTFYRIIRCNFDVNAGSAEHCNHALVNEHH